MYLSVNTAQALSYSDMALLSQFEISKRLSAMTHNHACALKYTIYESS